MGTHGERSSKIRTLVFPLPSTVTWTVYSPGEDSWVSHSSPERVGEAGVSLSGSSQLPAWMLTPPGLKPAVRGSQHEEGRVVPLAGRGAEAALGGPGPGLHGEDFGQALGSC